jgi:hypothetical protein
MSDERSYMPQRCLRRESYRFECIRGRGDNNLRETTMQISNATPFEEMDT